MRLSTVLFGTKPIYEKMARVLELSLKERSPDTPITTHHVLDRDDDIRQLWNQCQCADIYFDNARKTKSHNSIVQHAKDGELLGLLDCDMMAMGDLSTIQDYDFDFAYTVRPEKARYPFNTGIVFVRISDRTKIWYKLWYANVLLLFKEKQRFSALARRYGGINQCALGMLLESDHDLKIKQLPCQEWNLLFDYLDHFDENTKLIHIQGLLRDAIGGKRSSIGRVRLMTSVWRDYYAKVV